MKPFIKEQQQTKQTLALPNFRLIGVLTVLTGLFYDVTLIVYEAMNHFPIYKDI